MRHDFAVFAVALVHGTLEILPRTFDLFQLQRRDIPDVGLVRVVGANAFVRSKVRFNVFQILRLGINDAL